ncbi:S8 family serine peptidase [Azospirillum brasilense]|uniref:S8 family serine peptidase n=1 Tax=Azospirillum brasilense TaxID=192 RepID=UPI001EDBF05D|nr:S8 family serine peptidase [Azospirillum brasilense]UKJ73465.1 helix-turn-helix domain-containing protein [Azospirillum brasilense]
MTARFSFSSGAAVKLRGRSCTILEAVTASSVLIEDAETKETQVVPVSKLSHPDGDAKPEPTRALDSLPEDDLAEAKRRFAIIKPLVRCERRSQEDVKRVAEQHGVGLSTLYRWIKTYEGRRLMSDLAPRRKGRSMPKRLDTAVESVIDSVIKDLYLSKQKVTGEEVILEVHRRCRAAKLAKPAGSTIRKRLRAINPREKVLKREGRKAAHDKFGRVKGEFPGADSPLAVVQIDHTLLDIIVLDEEMRLPIGRPWLTLAIDVFSRMVVGYHLSLDHPSAFAVGLCLCHGMLDKAAELERLGIKGEWPVWGKPRMIHSDISPDGHDATEQLAELLVLTTNNDSKFRFATLGETSAATAAISGIAGRIMARYPVYWPETVRGLIVHSANWTSAMRARVAHLAASARAEWLLGMYGWGVPSEDVAHKSATDRLTMVVQDELVPFKFQDGRVSISELKYYELPWPVDALKSMGGTQVELRVTLSYFVEPDVRAASTGDPSRYCSHRLAFDLKGPDDDDIDVVRRKNKVLADLRKSKPPGRTEDGWDLKSHLRERGTIHHDRWRGRAEDLARQGGIKIYPKSGWWADYPNGEYTGIPVRYSLIISIVAPEARQDIYQAAQIHMASLAKARNKALVALAGMPIKVDVRT